jgi:hypothetical protein
MFWKWVQYPPKNPPVLKPSSFTKATSSLPFLSWKPAGFLKFLPVRCYFFHENPQDFWSSYPFFAISFMRTAGYFKFLPVVYPFFHENCRLFEVLPVVLPFLMRTAGYLKFLPVVLPFLSWEPQVIWSFYQLFLPFLWRQPQVIWSFYQFFAISFMKTAGYLKFLPVVSHFFHENRRLFEVSTSCLPFLSREPQVIWNFRNDQNQ